MARICSKLGEPACILACGVVMFTCHSVLKVDRKVDRRGYEECKWESYRGSSAWGQLFRSMENVEKSEG